MIKKGIYRHYKGILVTVLGIAKHSETLEEYVVYTHPNGERGDNELWVRPKKMFEENVIVDGKEIPRFLFIKDY